MGNTTRSKAVKSAKSSPVEPEYPTLLGIDDDTLKSAPEPVPPAPPACPLSPEQVTKSLLLTRLQNLMRNIPAMMEILLLMYKLHYIDDACIDDLASRLNLTAPADITTKPFSSVNVHQAPAPGSYEDVISRLPGQTSTTNCPVYQPSWPLNNSFGNR